MQVSILDLDSLDGGNDVWIWVGRNDNYHHLDRLGCTQGSVETKSAEAGQRNAESGREAESLSVPLNCTKRGTLTTCAARAALDSWARAVSAAANENAIANSRRVAIRFMLILPERRTELQGLST